MYKKMESKTKGQVRIQAGLLMLITHSHFWVKLVSSALHPMREPGVHSWLLGEDSQAFWCRDFCNASKGLFTSFSTLPKSPSVV